MLLIEFYTNFIKIHRKNRGEKTLPTYALITKIKFEKTSGKLLSRDQHF